MHAKGQLISKCPFGFIVWTKLPTKLFLNFCPEIFCTFLGASWKLFAASCRLPCLIMILYTKSPGSPKSFHEAPRKLQKNSGQKSRNHFFGIFVQTMKPKGHFEINWPLVISKILQILGLQPQISKIFSITKGQLISKCPFGVKTSSKKPTELFLYFCPEFFCTFLGGFLEAFWASWGLSK